MPLAWTHAEFIKLACSILEDRPVDRPETLWTRYHGLKPKAYVWYWTPQAPIENIPFGVQPGIYLNHPATIRWALNDMDVQIIKTEHQSTGLYLVRLPIIPQRAKFLDLEILKVDGNTEKVRIKVINPIL